jgi:hypothetical protein
VTWDDYAPPKNVLITVDDSKDGRIRCVIHELLHLVFYAPLSLLVDSKIEEHLILTLETIICNHVLMSPRRTAAWRKAIDNKSKDPDG